MQRPEGSKLKYFKQTTIFFNLKEFKLELQDKKQDIVFGGARSHCQNGAYEVYICTMVEKTRTVLFNDHTKWPDMVDIELLNFDFCHIGTKWNSTSRKDLEYRIPEEAFNGISQVNENKNYFPDINVLVIPVYILNKRIQGNKKIPKWEQRVKEGVYLVHSREHAANM